MDLHLAVLGLGHEPHSSKLDDNEGEGQHHTNAELAELAAYRILFARLLVFHRFLKQADARGGQYDLSSANNTSYHVLKRRWTYLQMQPEICLGQDVFSILSQTILSPGSKDYLRRAIVFAAHSIQQLIRYATIFTVFDDGQELAMRFPTSSRPSNPQNSSHRSILDHVISAWTAMHHTCIVSCTEIPLNAVQESVTFHSVKPGAVWEVFTNTGDFSDKFSHSSYIRRHLWLENLLCPAQEYLLQRASRWLRGRSVCFRSYSVQHV
jgi:hypothetical protein